MRHAQVSVLDVQPGEGQVLMLAPGGIRSFGFDHVFAPTANQLEVNPRVHVLSHSDLDRSSLTQMGAGRYTTTALGST